MNDLIVACNRCNLAIDDTEANSIQCDACDRWYHSWRQCSGLKKTIFKLLGKKDQWICMSCIDFCKSMVTQDLPAKLSNLNQELKEVRDLNRLFFEENTKLKQNINDLHNQINELKLNKINLCDRPIVAPVVVSSPDASSRCPIGAASVAEPENAFEQNTDPTYVNSFKGGFDFSSVNIMADSHGRRLRGEIEDRLAEVKVRVTSEIFPGAPMGYYSKKLDAGRCRSDAEEGRLCVVLGGVNDTARKSVDRVVGDLSAAFGDGDDSDERNFVVIVETPYRYDDVVLNESIRYQNTRLKELCDRLNWLYVPVNFSLSRQHYTKHGLHLNKKGKDILSSLVANSLKKIKDNFLV